MEEKNLVECKICKKLKMKIQDGMFDSKNKRWVGEDGTQWNGKKCPDCVRELNNLHQKKKKDNYNET